MPLARRQMKHRPRWPMYNIRYSHGVSVYPFAPDAMTA
jgi:hypothetical protein